MFFLTFENFLLNFILMFEQKPSQLYSDVRKNPYGLYSDVRQNPSEVPSDEGGVWGARHPRVPPLQKERSNKGDTNIIFK